MAYPPQSPLLRLPSELVQEIFQHLYSDDIAGALNLRKCCRLLRQESYVVLFKRIKFRGLSFEREMLARILHEHDGLAACVMTVEMACPLQVGMIEAFERLSGLRVIVWSSNARIAASMLDFLQARPQIQLHLVYRFSRPQAVRLDTAAMSSPSLHTLEATVYAKLDGISDGSEFSVVRKCLLKATGLKKLTLRLEQGQAALLHQPEEENLQLIPNDKLPTLESLTLGGDSSSWWNLHREHCELWLKCMDLSKLRTLDLTRAPSARLLDVLTGHVRGLLKLRLGFWSVHDHLPNGPVVSWGPPGYKDDLRCFLNSIDALEDVEVCLGERVDGEHLEPLLFQKHGTSLRRLIIRLGLRRGWTLSQLQELRTCAPHLEELEVPIEMHQKTDEPGGHVTTARSIGSRIPGLRQKFSRPASRSAWPTQVDAVLRTFPHLQYLKLRVQLKSNSTQVIPDPRPEAYCLNIHEMARETVMRLFVESRMLKTFSVEFRSVEPCVVQWMFTVKSMWVLEEGMYRAVVEKSTKGERAEVQRTHAMFDPWS